MFVLTASLVLRGAWGTVAAAAHHGLFHTSGRDVYLHFLHVFIRCHAVALVAADCVSRPLHYLHVLIRCDAVALVTADCVSRPLHYLHALFVTLFHLSLLNRCGAAAFLRQALVVHALGAAGGEWH